VIKKSKDAENLLRKTKRMTTIATVVLFAAILLVLIHSILVIYIAPTFWNWESTPLQDSDCPKTVVCLNLRGLDPFLKTALPALLNQDYPNYDVIIVVDHPDDPVYALAEEVIKASDKNNVKIGVLKNRKETCSLVNSSLIQTIQKNLNDYEVVAMIDADAMPHKTWLRELIAPLLNKKIGAVTGQRWYFPPRANMGDLIRYIWNIPAVLQMIFFRIPWGGSLAIRIDVLQKCKVLDYYEKTLVQDVPLFNILKSHGYTIEFVPSVLMINRESVTLSSLVPWIQRQLLWAILYHSSWWKIVMHGILVTIVPLLLLTLIATSTLLNETFIAVLASLTLIGYVGITLCQLLLLEYLVRRIIKKRNEFTKWLTPLKLIAFIPAMILTQLFYPKALLFALFSRNIEWRGINYRINAPLKVKMLNYEPYQIKKRKNKNSSL
jgi:cellulose synthase/poly-beta-1,6-N-acetylglucosamine synthase-like glycosyltransferase